MPIQVNLSLTTPDCCGRSGCKNRITSIQEGFLIINLQTNTGMIFCSEECYWLANREALKQCDEVEHLRAVDRKRAKSKEKNQLEELGYYLLE